MNNENGTIVNRAEIFLKLLEINNKVIQIFDFSQGKLGPIEQGYKMPFPSKTQPIDEQNNQIPGNHDYMNMNKENEKAIDLRNEMIGAQKSSLKQKYHDMNDTVKLQSDKDLPNFLHKLNLRLNLYQPDLKFTTINQK